RNAATGVRFAPTQTVEGSSSHVHFDEKLHDSVVMVSREKDGHFLVKVSHAQGLPVSGTGESGGNA
uniref:Uncharacterized protein n=1 Tax=Anolis carolinensis TaxID=28377 RepID=A0A803TZ87_ANOCA